MKRQHGRSARGTAELSVVVVAASLVAGVLFGNGVTRTAVDIADGLTWFTDDPTGQVIEVNPATGRPEAQLDVGDEGDDLDLAQYDGRLIVTNRTTGELSSFDLTSLLTSGARQVAPGVATDVLHLDGDVFLVDRERGTVASIDPVTTDPIGEMWSSPEGIADAAIDGAGRVWAIDPEGLLTELRWSTSSLTFVVEDTRQIDHSGARSALVGHDRGVTVFGADEGIVVQVGTDDDVVADAVGLGGELAVPTSAPSDLVPASSPDTGRVAIVGDGGVRIVDVATIGCAEPGRPEVFEGLVYVPCTGAGRVVRLTADGQRAGNDIEVTEDAGDPDLVLDDGSLLINVPGATHGAVVHADGSVTTIERYVSSLKQSGGTGQAVAPPIPVRPVNPVADPVGPAPGPGPSHPVPDPDPEPTPDPTTDPDPEPTGQPPYDPDQPQPLEPPTHVIAAELPSGRVEVTWHHGGDPADEFTVQEEGGPVLYTVSGVERQTSVPAQAGTHRYTVTAVRDGEPTETSAPSNPVSTSGLPGAVTGILGQVAGNPDDTTATISVRWSAAEGNGSPIAGYTVTMTDANGTQTNEVGPTTSTAFTSVCATTYCNPSPVTVSITATNAKGRGPAAKATLAYDGPEVPTLPAADRQLVTGASHTWQGLSWYGQGTTRLTLSPPESWREFPGTCTWTHEGNQTAQDPVEFRCDATNVSVPIATGMTRKQDNGVRHHSIVFTASNGTESVTSERFEWTTEQAPSCVRCS
ncbi:fibronectin type III domain-containing protein [Nocardioides sp. SR21]|uniref:fibronectin type III domain-containing protein n=1 Tax=Nocardioides sp. SR21 TaxID=2919501 RepID=UPI001FA99086|nr:fibronectin type III domain-containing protein [Nocardioides sp. SR21]